MDITPIQIERFNAYFQGIMNDEEKKAFLEEVGDDTALKEIFAFEQTTSHYLASKKFELVGQSFENLAPLSELPVAPADEDEHDQTLSFIRQFMREKLQPQETAGRR